MVNEAIEVRSNGGMMTLKSISDRVNMVHQVLEKVMVKGTHYGTVPGCGAKSVLFKPGADLLAMTFRLVPQFKVDKSEMENGHREYDVTCTMYAADGSMLGQGVGSGSTMEKKYRYRKQGDKQIENEDIADTYNTVLKMAKKRALIDATLTVTGAADMFTQDLIEEDDNSPAREPIREPQAKASAPVEGLQIVGVVEDVQVRDGETKGKPWRKFGVTLGGNVYGTFSDTLGAAAQELKGKQATISYKVEGKFMTLTGIEGVA